ncbi:MAG TPA: 2Fe-2S iron-sulfur cluster-binding protein [Candidatus Binataceae bacterium]|nr:2Fe-2S iron-sulfur cluster-binding protein [Candidatus Binataceae bacterium]
MSSPQKTVKVTVDNRVIEAPEGATLLQVMLDAEMDIPHYCYHPKLSIDGSCRLCQVKIEGMPKLQISCNTQVRDGMVVSTLDPEVQSTRRGVLELLLLNHPLDCPICDKAGECWLQNFAMRFGRGEARTVEPRRKRGKRLDIGERILLDQERCILCRRCVRFCREISKTGELAVFNNGDHSLLDIYDRRLDNDYSMCVADVCPVGALETKDFHHKMRVWFLEETASVCPSCSNGCNIMVSSARGEVWRLTPRRNDEVNDTWMCDGGRLNYKFIDDPERLLLPQVAGDAGLTESGWQSALERAAAALAEFIKRNGAKALGAVVSPHLTNEENYRFGELLGALGAGRVAMAVRRGPHDDFLIKAEKAPNARGVRELGLVKGADDGLEELLQACEAGEIKALYICGNDLLDAVAPERLEAILAKIELLIVQDLTLRPQFGRAAIVLPTTTFAEKDGTFTNHAGRVQRLQRSLATAPGWLADGEIFTGILNLVSSRRERFELGEVWAAMTRDGGAFAGLKLDEIGPNGAELGVAGGR